MPRLSDQDYRARLRFIRHYTTGFEAADGYDARSVSRWSPARKAQVTRYYEQLRGLMSRPHYVYRPRKKSNLDAAKKLNQTKVYGKINVGIIRVPTVFEQEKDGRVKKEIVKPKIKINKKGALTVKVKSFERVPIYFDEYDITPEELALHPEETIERLLNSADQFKFYTIMAGEYEILGAGRDVPQFHRPGGLINHVRQLQEKYSADNYDPENPSSSYYGNWLRGFIGYNFGENRNPRSYVEAQQRMQQEKKKITKQIKSAKAYITRLNSAIHDIRANKRLSKAEKIKRIKAKQKLILKQDKRIDELIISRLKSMRD